MSSLHTKYNMKNHHDNFVDVYLSQATVLKAYRNYAEI